MKEIAKKIARIMLGDYSVYLIYASPDRCADPGMPGEKFNRSVQSIEQYELESSTEPLILEQASYLGSDARAYACYVDGNIAGVCIYWFADRYRKKRNFWPLRDREAKLVQIVTAQSFRRRGVASELISSSHQDMLKNGFDRVYARIWHSNIPSLHAFERAGWSRIALVLEVNPFRREKPIRLKW